MPFIDKSTLTYPATNSFPVRKWLDENRDPTSNDFRQFQIFDLWINFPAKKAFIMVDRTATSGTWIQMATSGTGILTINGVPADGANNLNLAAGPGITISNNPGTNTVTIGASASVPLTFATGAGNAVPAANTINFVGSGGVSLSAAGSTVTITAAVTVPLTFHTDGADATPAANAITISGAGGITTSGAGSTITVTAGATIPTTFTGNAGSATPAANNLNVIGAGGITVSGAGSTLTILGSGGGLLWNHITVVGPTSMAINNGYVVDVGAQAQMLLPLTAVIGSTIKLLGINTGGFIITQNIGQSIIVGALTSTVGGGGSVAASEPHACVEIICVVANTTWQISNSEGNLIVT